MNFEQRIGEEALKSTNEGAKQEIPPVTEQKPGAPKITSAEVSEDENFPGSKMFKVKDDTGAEKTYVIRTQEDGKFEGNEIGHNPDGSRAWTQKLNEADLKRLQQQGILGKFDQIKKIEKTKKLDDAKVWLQRLYIQGINPYINQQADKNEQYIIDEAARSLQSLSDAEQTSLAETFSKEQDRSEKFHYVMVKLGDTTFGKKLAELTK